MSTTQKRNLQLHCDDEIEVVIWIYTVHHLAPMALGGSSTVGGFSRSLGFEYEYKAQINYPEPRIGTVESARKSSVELAINELLHTENDREMREMLLTKWKALKI